MRTAKIHLVFKRRLLEQSLNVERIMSHLVLFKCNVCNNRFPTFHPLHQPDFELQSTKKCRIDVASWDSEPVEVTRLATLHTGVCGSCQESLDSVENDPLLNGIAVFSGRNGMDPLFGMDDVALRREFQYLFENASVVESMLVSLHHMQVSVCYLRGMNQKRGATTGFQKNIISFPQELTELKHFQNYLLGLTVSDVIHFLPGVSNDSMHVTGRIRAITETGFRVETSESHIVDISIAQIKRRVALPL